jgi:hypothetical protein
MIEIQINQNFKISVRQEINNFNSKDLENYQNYFFSKRNQIWQEIL